MVRTQPRGLCDRSRFIGRDVLLHRGPGSKSSAGLPPLLGRPIFSAGVLPFLGLARWRYVALSGKCIQMNDM